MGVPNCRMVHTTIWESEQFISLTLPERLLFIGMITIGDDDGRLKGDPRFLKRMFFYSDRITTSTVKKMCDHLEGVGLITRYTVNGASFIAHPNWKKYQKLRSDRLKLSNIPAPTSNIMLPTDNQTLEPLEAIEVNKSQSKEKTKVNKLRSTQNTEKEIGTKNNSDGRRSPRVLMQLGIDRHEQEKAYKHTIDLSDLRI